MYVYNVLVPVPAQDRRACALLGSCTSVLRFDSVRTLLEEFVRWMGTDDPTAQRITRIVRPARVC